MSDVRLVVEFDITGLPPRETREAFADALRAAIIGAREQGQIDSAVTEELIRTVPPRGHA